MAKCELCGRAIGRSVRTLTPAWWPHDLVCRRPGCRAAVEDALGAVESVREGDELAQAIAQRHRAQYTAVGWRGDEMVRMDLDGSDWGALRAAQVGGGEYA